MDTDQCRNWFALIIRIRRKKKYCVSILMLALYTPLLMHVMFQKHTFPKKFVVYRRINRRDSAVLRSYILPVTFFFHSKYYHDDSLDLSWYLLWHNKHCKESPAQSSMQCKAGQVFENISGRWRHYITLRHIH
jgi:hypothetical protein